MIATISPGWMLSEKSSSATTMVSPAANSRRMSLRSMIGPVISRTSTSGRAAGHAVRCGLPVGFPGDDPFALVEAGSDLDGGAIVEAGLDLALAYVTGCGKRPHRAAAVGFTHHRQRGDDLHPLGLAGDDVHLGGHVGPQCIILVR